MRGVEGCRDVIIQISIPSLHHGSANPAVRFRRDRLTIREVSQWKETAKIGGQGLVLSFQSLFKNPSRIVFRSAAKRVQSDDALSSVINPALGRFRIHGPSDVEEVAVWLLT